MGQLSLEMDFDHETSLGSIRATNHQKPVANQLVELMDRVDASLLARRPARFPMTPPFRIYTTTFNTNNEVRQMESLSKDLYIYAVSPYAAGSESSQDQYLHVLT